MNQAATIATCSDPLASNVDVLGKLQVKLALLFMLVSAAPALYLSPAILALLFFITCIRISCFLVSRKHAFLGFPKYSLVALFILVYCVFSAMMTGLGVSDIFGYQAIRYDANIFYSFLPFFVISSASVRLSEVDRWIRAISLFAPIAYIAAGAVEFPLFESHNGAGGYFMVLMAYALGRFVVDGPRGWRLPLILLFFALIVSDSRGSLVAVLGIFIAFKVFVRFPRASRIMVILSVLGTIIFLAYTYSLWRQNGSVYLYSYIGFGQEVAGLGLEDIFVGERPGTVLHRLLFLFPMAIDVFLHSPIFGVGFTRFDDYPFQYLDIIGLFSINVTNSVLHTNLHAHNSYLHILAEMGLVGISLFGLLIRGIFRVFRHDRRVGVPVCFMLGALLIASFTEHRFTTPSQAAPVFLMIGILWACLKLRRSSLKRGLGVFLTSSRQVNEDIQKC